MRKSEMFPQVVASLLIVCVASGCATNPTTRHRSRGDVSTARCEAPKTSEHLLPIVSSEPLPDEGDEDIVELSSIARQTAATIRVLGLLKRIPRLEQEARAQPDAIWRLLWTRQQIVDRISLARQAEPRSGQTSSAPLQIPNTPREALSVFAPPGLP